MSVYIIIIIIAVVAVISAWPSRPAVKPLSRRAAIALLVAISLIAVVGYVLWLGPWTPTFNGVPLGQLSEPAASAAQQWMSAIRLCGALVGITFSVLAIYLWWDLGHGKKKEAPL